MSGMLSVDLLAATDSLATCVSGIPWNVSASPNSSADRVRLQIVVIYDLNIGQLLAGVRQRHHILFLTVVNKVSLR